MKPNNNNNTHTHSHFRLNIFHVIYIYILFCPMTIIMCMFFTRYLRGNTNNIIISIDCAERTQSVRRIDIYTPYEFLWIFVRLRATAPLMMDAIKSRRRHATCIIITYAYYYYCQSLLLSLSLSPSKMLQNFIDESEKKVLSSCFFLIYVYFHQPKK